MADKSQVLIDFCTLLSQFIDSVVVLSPNNILMQNKDIVTKFIENEPMKIISVFKLYILKYKPMVDRRDEKFFLNNTFDEEMKKADDVEFVLKQITDVKNIWCKLDNDTKESIWTYIDYLLQLTENYFS